MEQKKNEEGDLEDVGYLLEGEEVSFQVLSDTHIEFWDCKEISQLPFPLNDLPTSAPILVLLGDIGIPRLPLYPLFLESVSKKFKVVFVLSGNHEYYGGTIQKVDELILSIISPFKNIRYLQRKGFLLGNYVVLGATLWTLIPEQPEEVFNQYWYRINDYRQIKISHEGEERLITPYDTNRLHLKDKEWLVGALEGARRGGHKVCVFSHHAPTDTHTQCLDMRPGEKDNVLKYLDYSDQREFILKNTESVVLWGFGHTHHSSTQMIGNTQVVSNCLGYIKQSEGDPCFDPNFVAFPNKLPQDLTRGHYQTQPSPPPSFCAYM
eukprot:TRINITY_DN15285_c0_g1_i1.p1 TRINITY_DN15285_c0_g1~~TRINITY_DN15285_c0_g1_i1.p1  ORF type:complete len:322 (-),score=68.76 TRINITY_DN15285_c0_g1_i1:42-1007(-)